VNKASLALIVTLELASWSAAMGPIAQEPTAGLTIQTHSATPAYRDPERFRLVVSFHNESRNPVIILPSGIHRVYRPLSGGIVKYVALPGPRISPWRGSFVLAPGEAHSVELLGMRDGDGIWRLTSGDYELTVLLKVPAELGEPLPTGLVLPGARVWHGELVAKPIPVVYQP
jgi:hypothetical protein